jgi:HEAT repeat protein
MKKSYFFACIVLLFCAGLFWWRTAELMQNEVLPAGGSSPEETVSEPENRFPAYAWREGDRRMYQIHLESAVTLSTGFGTGEEVLGQKRTISRLDGTLNLRVLHKEENTIYCGIQLSPAALSFDGGRFPKLDEQFSTFFLALFVADGTPFQFFFPAKVPEEDQAAISELIRAVQVQISPEDKLGDQKLWEREEEHSMGRYRARYSVLPGGQIRKEKQSYQEIFAKSLRLSAGLNMQPLRGELQQSAHEAVVNSGSWIDKYHFSELIEIREGNRLWAEIKSSGHLQAIAFQPDMKLRIWNEKAGIKDIIREFTSKEQFMGPGVYAQLQQESAEKRWAHVPVNEMFLQGKHLSEQEDIEQTSLIEYVHNLQEYLETFPHKALEIPELIKEHDLSIRASAMILQALELAGHTQAQEALRNIMYDEGISHEIRVQSIVAAGGLQTPENFMVEAMWGLVDQAKAASSGADADGEVTEPTPELAEIRSTALLALGIMSSQLQEQGELLRAGEVNDRIRQELTEYEADAKEVVPVLLALDNAKFLEGVPVEVYLKADNPNVRLAALNSVVHDTSETADRLVLETFKEDADSKVREEAFKALSKRETPELMTAVTERLPLEQDKAVRLKMVNWLGEQKFNDPQALVVLEKQIKVEKSRELVKEIYRAVYRKEKVFSPGGNEDTGSDVTVDRPQEEAQEVESE